MEALQDPDIQRIAWERFGFRTSFLAPNNELLKTLRLPDTITSVTPLPGFETMKIILDSITYQSFKAQ